MELRDYLTGQLIRPAKVGEYFESLTAAEFDGGVGVILVDGRRCYVDDGPLGAESEQDILQSNNRQLIINWLVWNDSNGVYTDDDRQSEGWPPMTLAEAQRTMRDILARE